MRRRQGHTLGEVLMSMALLALVAVTALGILQWALYGSQTQQGKTMAALLAQRQMEQLLAEQEPRSGSGEFASPHQGFSWAARVEEIKDEPFLNLEITVNGPRGARYHLKTQRCKQRRNLVYLSNKRLLKTSEDVREDEILFEQPGLSEYSVSPDGKTQAFVDFEEGKPQIFERPLQKDGTITRLARHPEGMREPSYSPDGKSLAFVTQEDGRSQVFIWDLSTNTYKNRSQGEHHDGSPTWTPDGKGLIVCRDGNSLVLLGEGSEKVLVELEDAWMATPEMSKDGKTLLLMSSRDGNPELYTVDLATRQWKRLTDNPGYDEQPHFSPDGKRILFTSQGEDEVPRLYSMNPDGSALTPLTPDQMGDSPRWVP